MTGPGRLGLIVNPQAGSGWAVNARVARQVVEALQPAVVLVGPGDMGEKALEGLSAPRHFVNYAPAQGRMRTPALVEGMIAHGVDIIAVVGGDGTMADVAFALFRAGSTLPILGVGVGSANVGGLVTVQGREAARLAGAHLQPIALDALLAGANGEILGIAFNDVVISTTVLATIDGELTEVLVGPKEQGENIPGRSEPVWTSATRVWRESPRGSVTVAAGDQVGTMICGFADQRFFGKAIAGQVCLTSHVGLPAGCLVGSQPLVRMVVGPGELVRDEPFISHYVSFGEDDTIKASGFRSGVALCADGNPLKLLSGDDVVVVSVRRRCTVALRLT